MSKNQPGVEQDSAETEVKKKNTRRKTVASTSVAGASEVSALETVQAEAKTAPRTSSRKKSTSKKTESAPVVTEVAVDAAEAVVAPPVAEAAPVKKRTTRKKAETVAPSAEQAAASQVSPVVETKAEKPAAEKKPSRSRKKATTETVQVESAAPAVTPVAETPVVEALVSPHPPATPEPVATQSQQVSQDPSSAVEGYRTRRGGRGRRGRGSEARKKAAHQQAAIERNGQPQPQVQPQTQSASAQTNRRTDAPNHQTTNTPAQQTPKPALPKQRWYKVDLHMHTPGSNDYEDPQLSWLDWLRTVAERGLEIVAITDHNTVAGVAAIRREVEWLTRLEQQNRLTDAERADLNAWRDLSNRVLVLPGFEFTATFGFHILGVFPPETSVRTLEQLLLTLKVPVEKLDVGSTETGASADVLTAYKVIHDAGGLAIAAHANSTHGVALRDFPFGGQTKIAYTQDPNLDALEVTDLEGRGYSTARFFDGRKHEYPRRMHCIQGSDSHRVNTDPRNPKRLGIGERATEMFLEDASFASIAALLRSTNFNDTRPARPKDTPFDPFASARQEGASIVQSFHEAPSTRGGKTEVKLDAILADICAFANTSGGAIYVGATPRMERVNGLARPRQVEEQIEQAMELSLTPPLDVRFETIKSGSASILRIQVPKGEDRPYCLDGNRFYVRDEGETTLAVRDEIIAMVLETMNQRTVELAPGLESLALSAAPAPDGDKKTSATSRGKRGERKSKTANGAQAATNGVALQNGSRPRANTGQADPDDAFYLPQMGVEIVESATRNGNQFHTIRDMRKGTIVQNVTRKGARDLWSYAIRQQETGAIKPAQIRWQGNVGLAHVERRAGKLRYDLALREGDDLRIFYGVTQDGMEGPWAAFVQEE